MKTIDTSPELKNKDVKILKLIGSASMKCVYLAEIDGETVVLKVRRIRADKGLDSEIQDFEYLLNQIAPLLKEQFNLENIPNYSERIFSDIREEADLEIEANNQKAMSQVVQRYNMNNQSNIYFAVPQANETLSNGVLMIESMAEGKPLTALRNELGLEQIKLIEKELTRFFAFSGDKFIHADPHDGNIFIKQEANGKIKITFIDLGLAQKMPPISPELKNLIQDISVLQTINSITVIDLKVLGDIANFVNIKDLMSGGIVSTTILKSLWLNTSLKDKWQVANSLNIDPRVILPALNKLANLKNKLKEYGLDEQFNQLIELIGNKTIVQILNKSQSKTLKEFSLILLNELDNSSNSNFQVSQELWRFLLAISKSPYILEQIKESPELMQQNSYSNSD